MSPSADMQICASTTLWRYISTQRQPPHKNLNLVPKPRKQSFVWVLVGRHKIKSVVPLQFAVPQVQNELGTKAFTSSRLQVKARLQVSLMSGMLKLSQANRVKVTVNLTAQHFKPKPQGFRSLASSASSSLLRPLLCLLCKATGTQ